MPTWGAMLQELNKLQRAAEAKPPAPGEPSPFDIVRRKYLGALSAKTGRATIVYATSWLENKGPVEGTALSINLGDKQGFMEAVSNIKERELDLILTSPGGSPEAADSIMSYLRTRFDHIRAIVPLAAMSAATMMALACDEIVMGQHSQLGPIDPQFTVFTSEGPRSAPGQAILDQWELAKQECANPKNIGAWLPLLRSLLPGLIAQCTHSRALAEEFAAKALERHMFNGEPDAQAKAEAAARWFADFSAFKSHGRRVGPEEAKAQGLKVLDLEADNEFQDLVLSVHHAVRHTFNGTGTTKLIENHHGRAYLEMMNGIILQAPAGPPAGPQPMLLPGQNPPRQNRQARRHPGR
jgi:hypothetical protein